MITPIDFKVDDFIGSLNEQMARSLRSEDLHGAELIDNLILLKFLELYDVKQVIETKYRVPFVWLNIDPTPPELKQIAERYEVFLQRQKEVMICYLPFGRQLDQATLQIDIPNYRLRFVFIADANYNLVRTGHSDKTLSMQIANFRPLLVYRRLVIDCTERGGTDLHFKSVYVDKVPAHYIYYRIKREMVQSPFSIDYDMMQKICNCLLYTSPSPRDP